jgi:hypothetical protein
VEENSLKRESPRAEHFQSGPVLDQNIQPNRFYFFFSFGTEPNRKPVQTD